MINISDIKIDKIQEVKYWQVVPSKSNKEFWKDTSNIEFNEDKTMYVFARKNEFVKENNINEN